VHVNGLDAPVQTWLLRRTLPASVAVVVQDHGSGDPGVARADGRGRGLVASVQRSVRRTLMRAPDAFFFTAAAQAKAWQRLGLIGPRQPVYQVLEASTAMRAEDRQTARNQTGIHGDPAILWVGRLNENKSPLTVLEGFERSASRLPNAVLTMIYSSEDLLQSVRRRLDSSALLARRVKLLGAVPHERMAAFYSAADVFVLGSHHEGSGYALIEACACGLAPVVTDIPAFRVITGDGSIGALWPRDDAEAFADALVRVASRDRTTLRRDVVEHFVRRLSWSCVAREAVAAYADVLRRRGRR
jgi:glycosyltransferase involved in cell wall biosynthesis